MTIKETKGLTLLCFQRLCHQIFSAEKILDKLPKNRRDIQQKKSECKLFEGASQTCSPRRERKQHRRRRLRKRHLKSEVALLQTLSRLFHIVQFVKCWQFFLDLNSKILNRSSGKEKENRCLLFTSSTKREIMHFHVVVLQ